MVCSGAIMSHSFQNCYSGQVDFTEMTKNANGNGNQKASLVPRPILTP